MNEHISEIFVVIGIVVVYFYWTKFEMKQQFIQRLKEVDERLAAAAKCVDGESHGSKAKIHMREAIALMREIKAFDWNGTGNLDDLIAVRRQLCVVNYEVNRSLAAADPFALRFFHEYFGMR
jgi:hypothetical protein